MDSVVFSSNTGYASAGVLYVSTDSYFDAESCTFSSNYANETSVIQVLGSSTTYNNTINYCTFDSNSALKNTISLMYANTNIENSEFTYNTATGRTKNVFCGFSTITVYRT